MWTHRHRVPAGDKIVPEKNDMKQFPADHPRDNQPHTEIADLLRLNPLATSAPARHGQPNDKPDGHEHAVGVDVEWAKPNEDGMHNSFLKLLVEHDTVF